MTNLKEFIISVPQDGDKQFAKEIESLLELSAKEKSRGLNLKSEEYISNKIMNGDAMIATRNGELAGFCYIRRRKQGRYISISGIVISPKYRKSDLTKAMIKQAFELARKKYPEAKIFCLTTSPTIMRIYSELGYKPITYSKLSTSADFWEGCNNCLNFGTLKRHNHSQCLCSAMLFNPFSFNIEDEYELNEQGVEKVNVHKK